MANDWDPAAERSARPSLPIPPTEPSPLSANAVKYVFSELGNASRYLPRRGFSAAQPGVAGTPATPGYRAMRCGCGRGQRAIDTHGLAETATDRALNRGNFTAPHGLVICHWLSAAESSRQTGTAHGGLPVAHNKNADSISTIPRGFDFGLGDVGWCPWAGALDRGIRMAPPGTQGSRSTGNPGLRRRTSPSGKGSLFAARRGGWLDGRSPFRVPLARYSEPVLRRQNIV